MPPVHPRPRQLARASGARATRERRGRSTPELRSNGGRARARVFRLAAPHTVGEVFETHDSRGRLARMLGRLACWAGARSTPNRRIAPLWLASWPASERPAHGCWLRLRLRAQVVRCALVLGRELCARCGPSRADRPPTAADRPPPPTDRPSTAADRPPTARRQPLALRRTDPPSTAADSPRPADRQTNRPPWIAVDRPTIGDRQPIDQLSGRRPTASPAADPPTADGRPTVASAARAAHASARGGRRGHRRDGLAGQVRLRRAEAPDVADFARRGEVPPQELSGVAHRPRRPIARSACCRRAGLRARTPGALERGDGRPCLHESRSRPLDDQPPPNRRRTCPRCSRWIRGVLLSPGVWHVLNLRSTCTEKWRHQRCLSQPSVSLVSPNLRQT